MKTLKANLLNVDFLFNAMKYTFLTLIVSMCVAMLVHVISNPNSISFGSF